jgi:hypothetical protein
MVAYQYAWIIMSGGYYDAVRTRYGLEVANECELASWMRVGERVNPRYAKIANIKLETVLDSLKAEQLPLDNTVGLYPAEYDIKSPNHVIMTVMKCRTLDYFEKAEPERIIPMCHHLEKPVIEKYMINPKIKVTPLVLPPRKSPEDIACRWVFYIGAAQWFGHYSTSALLFEISVGPVWVFCLGMVWVTHVLNSS